MNTNTRQNYQQELFVNSLTPKSPPIVWDANVDMPRPTTISTEIISPPLDFNDSISFNTPTSSPLSDMVRDLEGQLDESSNDPICTLAQLQSDLALSDCSSSEEDPDPQLLPASCSQDNHLDDQWLTAITLINKSAHALTMCDSTKISKTHLLTLTGVATSLVNLSQDLI